MWAGLPTAVQNAPSMLNVPAAWHVRADDVKILATALVGHIQHAWQ